MKQIFKTILGGGVASLIAVASLTSCNHDLSDHFGVSDNPSTGVTEITIDLTAIADEYLNDEKTQLNLKVGDEVTLSFNIKPAELADAEVTLTSEDPTIVSIDGKKVKALLAGTTKVTAKAGDKSVTCTVTVKDVYTAYDYKAWDETEKILKKQTAASATTTEITNTYADGIVSGWYTITGDNVTITGDQTLTGDVHLILCDGAKLTVNGMIDCESNDCNLYIYGQDKSDGQLYVTYNGGEAIYSDDTGKFVEIHGGEITAENTGIGLCGQEIKMYGGKITATSTSANGIQSENFEVYGGKVKGTGGAGQQGFYGNLKSGTEGIKFYFSDDNTTWDAGTSFGTATHTNSNAAYIKQFAKAE